MDAALLDAILDDLIEPVMEIADREPTNDWPAELRTLIYAARDVRQKYGFEVEEG